jgi:hypothetical protein
MPEMRLVGAENGLLFSSERRLRKKRETASLWECTEQDI